MSFKTEQKFIDIHKPVMFRRNRAHTQGNQQSNNIA